MRTEQDVLRTKNRIRNVFEAAGLDKPNIGILDDEFLAELLERLLEGEIKSSFAGNVVQNQRFSELL
ncbi:hypothetical protein TSA66_24535 [Noviherbaspirillum autotrophicum]|uniref:Type I restriction enzyme HindI endonuclease subunit-like C-terminal domain-containing protein n=1 Tax=Noviherbaspirillum autotrophicum TaxID=709839 RepID=A0A0C2BTB1_9BURK|nr:hypothetical protein TSA66_24535 [Noviherbaspirillum autotrophicum]